MWGLGRAQGLCGPLSCTRTWQRPNLTRWPLILKARADMTMASQVVLLSHWAFSTHNVTLHELWLPLDVLCCNNANKTTFAAFVSMFSLYTKANEDQRFGPDLLIQQATTQYLKLMISAKATSRSSRSYRFQCPQFGLISIPFLPRPRIYFRFQKGCHRASLHSQGREKVLDLNQGS